MERNFLRWFVAIILWKRGKEKVNFQHRTFTLNPTRVQAVFSNLPKIRFFLCKLYPFFPLVMVLFLRSTARKLYKFPFQKNTIVLSLFRMNWKNRTAKLVIIRMYCLKCNYSRGASVIYTRVFIFIQTYRHMKI